MNLIEQENSLGITASFGGGPGKASRPSSKNTRDDPPESSFYNKARRREQSRKMQRNFIG